MIILGIDPGIAIVGYGIIEYKNNKFKFFKNLYKNIKIYRNLNNEKAYKNKIYRVSKRHFIR